MHGRELIAFLAMAMALSALGIDLLLPAFPDIRAEFGLPPGSTVVSRFITAYFIGLAAGQLIIGPLADRFGRRTLFRLGIVLYAVGAWLTIVAPSFTLLLVARLVWGLGASTGRVLAIAIVRDRFVGAAMARTVSLIMAVFITVPVVAPALGMVLLRVLDWDQMVMVNLVAAAGVLLWTSRLEETLPPEARRPLSARDLTVAAGRVLRHPSSGPLVLAQAVLFGGFASYLSTSEVVYGEVFERAGLFPLLFGGMALTMGIATLVNGRLVERVGLDRMLRFDLGIYLIGALALVALSLVTGGRPPLIGYVLVLAVLLSGHAVLIPNLNARAMEPMGDIAGTASAINGSVLIGIGALIGAALDRTYDGTVLPLALALMAVGLVSAGLLQRSEVGLTGTGGPSRGRRGDRPPGDRSASRLGPS
jgi:DHA1 family bicyclomycin/chloramphenicol resistance-like MFS transporter